MAQRSAPFVSWGLSMPAPAIENMLCRRCWKDYALLFFRRSAGAWLCRGCAQSPSTRPLGTRYG